jgi:hypothetical protein
MVRHRAAAAAIGLRRPNLNIQRADYRGANLNVRAQEGPNGSSGDLKGGRDRPHLAETDEVRRRIATGRYGGARLSL